MISSSKTAELTDQPRVSIIVPAYNEAGEIKEAISQMTHQDYSNREILIVDDGSTDRTFEVASGEAASGNGIRVIRASHGGPSFARNLGVKESTGEVIFFGECDCVYDSDYVQKAIETLRNNPKAGAVCLTGAPLTLKRTFATDCIELENVLQHVLLKKGKIKPFYAWVFTRKAFESVGGFDEKLFQAEDRDLFGRVVNAGFEIALVPGINWRHKRVDTLNELIEKWFRRGRTRVLFSIKNRKFSDLAKTLLPFWLFVSGIILLAISPVVGAILVLLVVASILVQTLRVASNTWSAVKRKRVFFEYPIFLASRNFSSALGYTYGVIRILILKTQNKEVSFKTV
jgi:glycosyltransferase involved in cell wall biosynthesis